MTPIEKYATDTSRPRRIALAAMWEFALPTKRTPYIGERRGVWVDGSWRQSDGIVRADRRYTVRVLPGGNPRYLVGTADGRFLDEVTPDESETERHDRLERNRVANAWHDRLFRLAAAEDAGLVADRGTPPQLSKHQERKAVVAARPVLASPEAALEVPDLDDAA